MSQPFILNDERLMGQSNHRMPVAVEKGVEGGTARPLIFLSQGEEAKEEGLDLTKRDPCRQSKDFNNDQKTKREFSAFTQRSTSRSIQGFKKGKKKKIS